MSSPYRMLGDRVLIKSDDKQDRSKGGILLPGNAQQKPQHGTVLAVGPGKYVDGLFLKVNVNVGERVLFQQWVGQPVPGTDDSLIVMDESGILAVCEEKQ